MSRTRYPSSGSGVLAGDAEYQRRALSVKAVFLDRIQPKADAATRRALAMAGRRRLPTPVRKTVKLDKQRNR